MDICLITCNIRFDNPADGENNWNHRREILRDTLLAHSPDIIATQEGRYHQLKDLEFLLKGYSLIDPHRSWIKERMYPSIFIKDDRFEILKSEDLWLSETPHVAGSKSFGSAFPRLFTWVKLQPKGHERSFLLVNTHLDHVKKETRLKQVGVLIQEIQKIKGLCPLIIMGDFNDHPGSEIREELTKAFSIQDSWKIFNSVEETSHHNFTGVADNGSRIDWILVDPVITVKDSLLDKSSRDGRYPSDHFPVICRIKL